MIASKTCPQDLEQPDTTSLKGKPFSPKRKAPAGTLTTIQEVRLILTYTPEIVVIHSPEIS